MLIKKERLNNQAIHTYSKKQKSIVALSSLVAGLGLVLVAGVGYLFYFLAYEKAIIDYDTLSILSAVFLILSLGSLIFFSFTQMSIGKFLFLFPIYIISSGIGFSSLFALFNGGEMLMIFGIAGLSMLLSSILGFILPTKVVGSLMKYSMITMFFVIIGSLIFGILSMFTFSSYNIPIWSLVVTILMAFICVSYNIYLFHSLSKMQEFNNVEMDSKSLIMISLTFGFSLLVSAIQLIWIIARLYYYFK